MYTPIPTEPPETEIPPNVPPETQPREPVDATKASCWQEWKDGRFTIMPEDNCFMDLWDVNIIMALLATAVLLPFEVALIAVPPHSLYVLDKCIDVIFTVDIIVNFNVAYTLPNAHSSETYQRAPLKIARHYMSVPFSENLTAGWFWPDVLTVFPWEVVTSDTSVHSMRLVRVLRLVRMLRLVRVIKLFRRWHTHLGFSFALVKAARCMGITLLVTHWLACLWAHIGLYADDYMETDADKDSWLSRTHLASAKAVHEFSLFEVYSLALYFCIVVLTTVGFGDIVPLNDVEIVMMTVTLLLTGIIWTWVVANIVDIISNLDLYALRFNQAMDDLNMLMASYRVSPELKRRIRRHLHEAYYIHQERHHQDVIKWLSDGLQGQLAVEAGVAQVCGSIWYFQDVLRSDWMIDIAQHFKADMFSPNEIIMHKTSVSVIRKGSCVRKGAVLIREAVIGEDMILMSDFLKDSSCARTLTICEVMSLSRSELVSVCEKHETLNQRIRKAQVKLAVWRAFVLTARKIRAHRRRKGACWDSYFDGSAAQEEQQLKSGFASLLRGSRRPGWVESMAAMRGGPLQSQSEAAPEMESSNPSAEALLELRALRERLEEHRAEALERLDALAARLPPPEAAGAQASSPQPLEAPCAGRPPSPTQRRVGMPSALAALGSASRPMSPKTRQTRQHTR